jgi:hypothetical protein
MTVIDTNTNCTKHIGTLLMRGVTVVGRYYGVVNPDYKITQPEAQALSLAQIRIFAIYEDTSHYLPLTEDRGKTDGANALRQARAIGQPLNTPIYFTLEGLHLDLGYTESDLPGIRNYFKGVKASIAGNYTLGAYSDGIVCKTMRKEGICTHTWLSASTDFVGTKDFYRSQLWDITQYTPVDQDWDGVSVDVNAARGDFGSFVVPIT